MTPKRARRAAQSRAAPTHRRIRIADSGALSSGQFRVGWTAPNICFGRFHGRAAQVGGMDSSLALSPVGGRMSRRLK
jgi:hypothetical protein